MGVRRMRDYNSLGKFKRVGLAGLVLAAASNLNCIRPRPDEVTTLGIVGTPFAATVYKFEIGHGEYGEVGLAIATPGALGALNFPPLLLWYHDWAVEDGRPIGSDDTQIPLIDIVFPEGGYENNEICATTENVLNEDTLIKVVVTDDNQIYTTAGVFRYEDFNAEEQRLVRDDALVVNSSGGIIDVLEDGTYRTEQTFSVSLRRGYEEDFTGTRIFGFFGTDDNNLVSEIYALTVTDDPEACTPNVPRDYRGLDDLVSWACVNLDRADNFGISFFEVGQTDSGEYLQLAEFPDVNDNVRPIPDEDHRVPNGTLKEHIIAVAGLRLGEISKMSSPFNTTVPPAINPEDCPWLYILPAGLEMGYQTFGVEAFGEVNGRPIAIEELVRSLEDVNDQVPRN